MNTAQLISIMAIITQLGGMLARAIELARRVQAGETISDDELAAAQDRCREVAEKWGVQ
jgi:hypothetical protein